jgi:hypothetical protein
MLSMLDTWHDHSLRNGVAGQFVCDHHTQCDSLLLEQIPQQAFRRYRVALALYQDVEHDPC